MMKSCLFCKKNFSKPYTCSVRTWNERKKYCSAFCRDNSKIGVEKPLTQNRVKKMRLTCNKSFMTKKSWETKTKYCSKTCANQGKIGVPSWNKGVTAKDDPRILSREKISTWKGGITSINRKIRNSVAYKEWRNHVFQRDNWTCQACGQRGGELQADHELPFSLFPDLRLEILNGRTLCVECHKLTPTYSDRSVSEKIHLLAPTAPVSG